MRAKEIKLIERALKNYSSSSDYKSFRNEVGTVLNRNNISYWTTDEGLVCFKWKGREYTHFEIVTEFNYRVRNSMKNAISQFLVLGMAPREILEVCVSILKDIQNTRNKD